MRKHDIVLSERGIDATITELEQFEKALKSAIRTFCERLKQIGITTAVAGFGTAKYDGISMNSVEATDTDDGFVIKAFGNAVFYIEYGAGVHYNSGAEYPEPKPPEIDGIGMHGTHGKDDYWFYTGQPGTAGGELAHGHSNSTITHGNPANMPMFNSKQEMRNAVEKIAWEVFGAL